MQIWLNKDAIYQISYSAFNGKEYLETFDNEPIIIESIVDHDKQVRKEVCERLIEMLTTRAELIDTGFVAEFMFTTYDLQESVKEILSENE